MSKGRSLKKLGMAHRLRPCAYNSRLLASSSGFWSASQLPMWLDSQCFKYRARTLVNRTKLRLTVNNTIAADENTNGPSLAAGTKAEVLRSLLEMPFNMMTICSSLSLGVACRRMKQTYIERTAPKRPDY